MLCALLSASTALSSPMHPLPRQLVAHPASAPTGRAAHAGALWPLQPSQERFRPRSSSITMFGPHDRAHAFTVLGLRPGASNSMVKKAYRDRAKKCHPDINSTPAAAQEFRMLTDVSAPPWPLAAPVAVLTSSHALS